MVENGAPGEKQQTFQYDKEWIDLIMKAKRTGLSPTEVRDFLKKGIEKAVPKNSQPNA